MGSWINDQWVWDLRWREEVAGENVLKLAVLKQIISSTGLTRGRKDTWAWIKEGDDYYSVRSAYDLLAGVDAALEIPAFKCLWKAYAPSNAVALGWRILHNRIQTKVNLARRNIISSDILCPWCGSAEENTSHLIFHCEFAWGIWSLVSKWLGVHFVYSDAPSDHLIQFYDCMSGNVKYKRGLLSIWLAIVWHIWIARNAKLFKEESASGEEIFELARTKAWYWLRARNKDFLHSLWEWVNEPLACLGDL
ncbi:uncharacterized protein LOC130737314 [Lotus japonicus]|uniref:uncharacterized protein LOC130737314 n=1 Tax=Lotus japonicus TaxID=34305 RepID=UPI0025911887|nr:uncharacterized protein LOC130737314 [Lotus japonicus]